MATAVAAADAAVAGPTVASLNGGSGCDAPDFSHIGGDACDQFARRAESLQWTDFRQQIDVKPCSVEITAEAIEVDFDFLSLLTEGGVWSDADGSGPCLAT